MAILVKNFERWLGQAKRGDPDYTYHRGDLACDRFEADGTPNEINLLAKRAYRAYEDGEVELLQERSGEDGIFLYLARRCKGRLYPRLVQSATMEQLTRGR